MNYQSGVAVNTPGRAARCVDRILSAAARLTYGSWTAGALTIVRRSDERYLVVRQTYRSGWTLPGGYSRRHEAAEETARRELREEVGLDLKLRALTVNVDPDRRCVDSVFLTDVAEGVEPSVNSWEIAQVAWLSAHEYHLLRPEARAAVAALKGGLGFAAEAERLAGNECPAA